MFCTFDQFFFSKSHIVRTFSILLFLPEFFLKQSADSGPGPGMKQGKQTDSLQSNSQAKDDKGATEPAKTGDPDDDDLTNWDS